MEEEFINPPDSVLKTTSALLESMGVPIEVKGNRITMKWLISRKEAAIRPILSEIVSQATILGVIPLSLQAAILTHLLETPKEALMKKIDDGIFGL
jgi:hypothetical protein